MYDNITHDRGEGDHYIVTDTRLSLKAKGLWFSLWWLSVMDDSRDKFTLAGFTRDYSGDGVVATQNAFAELKKYGYVKETRQNYQVRFYTLYERG